MKSDAIKIADKYNSANSYNLIFNDVFSVFNQIKNTSIDHCITDPPYNISGYDGKKAIGWLKSNKYWTEKKNFQKIDEKWDKFSDDDYKNFTLAWLSEVMRVVKPNGNLIIFGTYHNIYKIGEILQGSNRKIVNSIVWYKRNAFPNITQRMLCESTEHMVWAVNETSQKAKNWTFNYKDLKEINSSKFCDKCKKALDFNFSNCPYCANQTLLVKNNQMRNVWEINSTPINEKGHGKHPSQKPLEVIKRLITGWTKKGDTIIDPFMGSGTVPVVAKLMNRKFIGIDNQKEYCELALKRLDELKQGQLV